MITIGHKVNALNSWCVSFIRNIGVWIGAFILALPSTTWIWSCIRYRITWTLIITRSAVVSIIRCYIFALCITINIAKCFVLWFTCIYTALPPKTRFSIFASISTSSAIFNILIQIIASDFIFITLLKAIITCYGITITICNMNGCQVHTYIITPFLPLRTFRRHTSSSTTIFRCITCISANTAVQHICFEMNGNAFANRASTYVCAIGFIAVDD